MEGVSTACCSLDSHDDILPGGSLLPPSSFSLCSCHSSLHLCSPPSPDPHQNGSFSFSISHLDTEEKSSALVFGFVLFIFSSSLPPKDGFLGALSRCLASLPSPSLPLPSSSVCRPVLCFSHHVTSAHDPELCNGAAHAGSFQHHQDREEERWRKAGTQKKKKHSVVFLCFASPHLLTNTTTSFSVFHTELFSYCEEGATHCLYPTGAL